MQRITIIASLLLLLTPAAYAEEANGDVPPPPPPIDDVYREAEEGLEPQVTIIRRGEEVIEEYRHNGRLYMIKITPTKGLPYYLIDNDGDGSLESRRNSLDNPEVVQWRIFSW